jgi:ketosteroid isomerase-like protein
MRTSYAFALIVTLFTPATAVAGDENLKQVVEKIRAAYVENFNKQNPAGIAALYADGGIIIDDTGPHTNIAEYYEGAFKAGLNHEEATVDEVWPLGTDALLAIGQYHITGKSESGEPIELTGFWTATDIRENDNWKIRMLSGFPKAALPQK